MGGCPRWARITGLAFAGAVLLAPVAGAVEGDYILLGPLSLRAMTPLDLLRLDLPPAPGQWTSASWSFEFHHQHANTFAVSQNVAEYLGARDRRVPLTGEDVENIFALEGDAFYLDGDVGILNLTTTFFFDDRWGLYLSVPALYFRGGIFDGAIESIHEDLNLGSGGRDLVAADQFQLVLDVGGERFSMLEPEREYGLGDPTLGLRHRFPLDGRWAVTLEGAVKIPVAEEESFFSSGELDYGFQVSVQRRFRRHGLYLGLSNVWVGGLPILETALDDTVLSLQTAWEFAATRHTSLVFQAIAGESYVHKSLNHELTAAKFEASIGVRHRRGGLVLDFAVIENLKNLNNTPDVGIYWGIGFTFGATRS